MCFYFFFFSFFCREIMTLSVEVHPHRSVSDCHSCSKALETLVEIQLNLSWVRRLWGLWSHGGYLRVWVGVQLSLTKLGREPSWSRCSDPRCSLISIVLQHRSSPLLNLAISAGSHWYPRHAGDVGNLGWGWRKCWIGPGYVSWNHGHRWLMTLRHEPCWG
jgi:hypothetical protein